MIFLKILLVVLLLLVVPSIIGSLPKKFIKGKYNLFFSLIVGYIIEFALLEIIAIPMILLKLNFSILVYTIGTCILILLVLAIILNLSNIKNIKNKENRKKFEPTYIIAIILVIVQVVISILYTHIDTDDSFYIGTATTTIEENSMYTVSAYTGETYEKLPSRYVLAPFSLYTAIIAFVIDLNPTIVAHSILSPIFICLSYGVYMLIASKLFNDNKKDVGVFIILLSIINIFGNFSVYTSFSFLLFRIWQGKAILCNIMLPMILFLVWNYIEDRCFMNWLLIFLTMIATCFVTEMGIALGSITLILLALIFSIKNKKITDLVFLSLCEIPFILIFVIYLMIK